MGKTVNAAAAASILMLALSAGTTVAAEYGLSEAIAKKTSSIKSLAGKLAGSKSTRVIVLLKSNTPGLQAMGDSEAFQAALRNPTTHESAKAEVARAIAPVVSGLKLDAARTGLITFTTTPGFAAALTAEQIDALAKDPRVESIEVDEEMKLNLDMTIPLIETPAPAAGATGVGKTVVVIDTGVQRNHPFIGLARVAAEACFQPTAGCPNGTTEQIGAGAGEANVSQPHGTHVAGIVMGNRAAGSPRRGVANRARVVPINIFGAASTTSTSAIQRAFEHVLTLRTTQPALQIAAVNMSVGAAIDSAEACDTEANMLLLRPVIDNLRRLGVASVISAGNASGRNGMGRPACLSSMISVAATSKTGVVASYTDISQTTDLFAPGGDFPAPGCVVSSVTGSAFDAFCGTSMAAPHVAGAFAALRSRYPTASVPRILQALRLTGLPTTDTRSGGLHSKPRIRLTRALNNLAAVLTPPNNNIANATPIAVSGLSRAIGYNVGATLEAGEPRHAVATANRSVWWRFRSPTTGNFRISTLGSDFNTVLALYGGSTIPTLGPAIASNNNFVSGVTFSEVTAPLVAGRTYYVAVAGTSNVEEGSVHLTIQPALVNDNFANARNVVIGASPVTVTGLNTGATREAGEPIHISLSNSTSVWYRFTAAATGTMTINTLGSSFDTVLGAYTGASVGALSQLAINDDISSSVLQSRISFPTVAGQVYRIVVTGFNGASGNINMTFTP